MPSASIINSIGGFALDTVMGTIKSKSVTRALALAGAGTAAYAGAASLQDKPDNNAEELGQATLRGAAAGVVVGAIEGAIENPANPVVGAATGAVKGAIAGAASATLFKAGGITLDELTPDSEAEKAKDRGAALAFIEDKLDEATADSEIASAENMYYEFRNANDTQLTYEEFKTLYDMVLRSHGVDQESKSAAGQRQSAMAGWLSK